MAREGGLENSEVRVGEEGTGEAGERGDVGESEEVEGKGDEVMDAYVEDGGGAEVSVGFEEGSSTKGVLVAWRFKAVC